ncbi:unnamed protein product [Prunus brigantina]
MFRNRMNIYKHRIIPDAGELREKHPNSSLQVTLEKDPRSDIPDADMKKFLVYGDMPLRDFVSFIRMRIRVSRKKRIFVYCRNTEPPFDALMSTIDEENKDEDGFLHITFSGEGRVCGSNEEQECSVSMI